MKKGTRKVRNMQWEKRIAAYVSTDVYNWAEKKAASIGMKPASYVRQLLMAEKQKEENPI